MSQADLPVSVLPPPEALVSVAEADLPPQFEDERLQDGRDLCLYRDRTLGLLRRYFRFSIEVGRLPSLLGRELFRAKVSAYSARTFEDAVIFVHDVEHCLQDLDEFDRKVLGKIVFQDYTHDEAARLLRCGRKKIWRRFPEIIDLVSESLLEHGLLCRFQAKTPITPETCQEGKTHQFPASDCYQGKNNFENVTHFPP